jgi:hypothetical protein
MFFCEHQFALHSLTIPKTNKIMLIGTPEPSIAPDPSTLLDLPNVVDDFDYWPDSEETHNNAQNQIKLKDRIERVRERKYMFDFY